LSGVARAPVPGRDDQPVDQPVDEPVDEPLVVHASSARMAEVGDEQAQLVLTGPPYFPAAVEAVLTGGQAGGSALAGADLEALARQTLQFAWGLRPVFDECWRILPPGGWLVVQTRDVRLGGRLLPVQASHRELLEAVGFQLYACYLWRPAHTPLARRRVIDALTRSYAPLPFDPEVFMAFTKPGPVRPGEPTAADIELLQRDVMRTAVGHQPARHRHQSPLPVMQAFVRACSRPGDLVVDPFAGGGTVLRAAALLGRRAVGYEIDPESVATVRRNLAPRGGR
jgi:DNA modification methylase